MTDLPILYSFRRCPYAIRARLAIASAGLPVELREVVLRDKAPEFLAASPSATVPCLVLSGGEAIDESLDIMLWALRDRDPEGWLAPPDGSIDQMLALIGECDGPFKHHLDRYKYHTRYEGAVREEERTAASAFVVRLDMRLSQTPWLFGARPVLADFAILPFVRQFANTDRSWFDATEWPAVAAWLSAFEASERFGAVMQKVGPWRAGEVPLVFGRDGIVGKSEDITKN